MWLDRSVKHQLGLDNDRARSEHLDANSWRRGRSRLLALVSDRPGNASLSVFALAI